MKKTLFPFLTFLLMFTCAYGHGIATERFIDSNQAQLFCRTLGQGKPLIVLHGGPGFSQDYLLPQLYKLAENNFVIFYDQRGCGRSTGEITPETINLETYVADLDAIRKAFGFETVSILGHSWGAFLAEQYAMIHPESVDKLVLSNSWPSSFDGVALFMEEYDRRMCPFIEEIEALHDTPGSEDQDPELLERLQRIIFRAYCYNPEKADLLNIKMTATAAANCAKVHVILQENLLEPYDLHDALTALKMPTLVIHGDYDPIPPITAQWVHESIAGSQFILMHNCGHFPYVEEPDAYFEHLDNFLKD